MQLVLLILGSFSVCWLPYFIVACAQIFNYSQHGSPTVYKAAFTLAISNSGINPLIYAWKNTGLRTAFGRLLRFRHPDQPAAYKSSTNRRRRSSKAISESLAEREYIEDKRIIATPVAVPIGIDASVVVQDETARRASDDRRLVDILHIDIWAMNKSFVGPTNFRHSGSTTIQHINETIQR